MLPKPTHEQLWNEELEEIQSEPTDTWRHGSVMETIYHREEDNTHWRAVYRVSADGETNELREGYADITQVEPRQVTVTQYVSAATLQTVPVNPQDDDGRR